MDDREGPGDVAQAEEEMEWMETANGSAYNKALPQELLMEIMNRLSSRPLAVAASVCRGWRIAAMAVNCVPRFRSALSSLPVLEDAMDAVLEDVLAAPFVPDFAIIFVDFMFELSEVSALLKRKLPQNLPLIACKSDGIVGVSASRESRASSHEPGWCQHGIVLSVGRFPGVNVKALKLHNSLSVEDVKAFVAAASATPDTGHGLQPPLAILLLGDPAADTGKLFEALDRAYGGKSIIGGGLAGCEDQEERFLLVHSAENIHTLEENIKKANGELQQTLKRVAAQNGETGHDFVALVLSECGSSSSDGRTVQCGVAAAGALKGVGPVYKVVSTKVYNEHVICTDDRAVCNERLCTQITCEREGEIMDGERVIEDVVSQINAMGEAPYHIGIFRERKNPRQQHFSVHEVIGVSDRLYISGNGVRTRDSFRFYQADLSGAHESFTQTLSSLANQVDVGSGGKFVSNHREARAAAAQDPLSRRPLRKRIIGGLTFRSVVRSRRDYYDFYEEPHLEACDEKPPDASMAGMYSLSEFGPPAFLSGGEDVEREKTQGRLLENFLSTVCLLFYTEALDEV